jgi:arylsulfatase
MARPFNVVIVVVGGGRADHLSCYGYARPTSPILDDLAQEGVRFANAFTTAGWTLPAHAALLTGLHSVSHGATSESPQLQARLPTLAERLRGAGYRTAAFSPNPWVSPRTGLGRGFDAFFTQRYESPLAMRAVALGRRAADRLLKRSDRGARRTNVAALRWLASVEQPFFAYVHYDEARLPALAPPPFERLFAADTAAAARAREVNEDATLRARWPARLADRDRSLLMSLYDGALRYVDQCAGELVEGLKELGVWDDTLLVATADHGESFGEHDIVGHGFGLYEEVLHVPLLMRGPGHLPAGYVIDELAQATDLLPTVLSLCGVDSEWPALHGRPLVQGGRATRGPEMIVAERFRFVPDTDVSPEAEVRTKAIRTRRDKFIWRSDEANELYDLVTDPTEQHNRIDSSTARADALRRQLFDWLASVESFENKATASEEAVAVGSPA